MATAITRSYSPDTRSANKGEIVISGAFSTNGTSDPVAFRGPAGLSTDLPNGIVSIVYSATGISTLTFEDQFYAGTGAQVHLSLATAADKCAQFNGFANLSSSSSSLTATITTLAAGSAAAVAAASGSEVWFEFRFKKTAAK